MYLWHLRNLTQSATAARLTVRDHESQPSCHSVALAFRSRQARFEIAYQDAYWCCVAFVFELAILDWSQPLVVVVLLVAHHDDDLILNCQKTSRMFLKINQPRRQTDKHGCACIRLHWPDTVACLSVRNIHQANVKHDSKVVNFQPNQHYKYDYQRQQQLRQLKPTCVHAESNRYINQLN